MGCDLELFECLDTELVVNPVSQLFADPGHAHHQVFG